jgi:hypothetical protein
MTENLNKSYYYNKKNNWVKFLIRSFYKKRKKFKNGSNNKQIKF